MLDFSDVMEYMEFMKNRRKVKQQIAKEFTLVERICAKVQFNCHLLKYLVDTLCFDGRRKFVMPPLVKKIVDRQYRLFIEIWDEV